MQNAKLLYERLVCSILNIKEFCIVTYGEVIAMPTISLCMIVKNEEDTLARCLQTVEDLVDEFIIVDTGSTDQTKEIARKYTDKVYDFAWIDDFSAARNYAYKQATMEYILWLDADDVLLPADRVKFQNLKHTLDPSIDVVMMTYHAAFDSQGNATLSYLRERLSKRSGNYQWEEPVHEYLAFSGKIFIADICITHLKVSASAPGRNLAIYKKILLQGRQLSARGLYYYARELKDNEKYEEAIAYFTKFLDSGQGWVEDNINACLELAHCYTAQKNYQQALMTLMKGFVYDLPRAEACCGIGYHFKNAGNLEKAIFWFELATKLKKPENSWGFIQEDYWGFIPCIELCVCYDQLGNRQEAIKYHHQAAAYKPNDPSVIFNQHYFEKYNLTESIDHPEAPEQ